MIDNIKKVKNGDQELYREVISELQKPLYAYIYKIIKNHYDAEDVLQDVFITAFYKLPSLKDDSKFKSWIYQIAYTKSLEHLRKQKRIVVSEIVEKVDLINAEDKMTDLINSLKPEERSLLLLKVEHGFSFNEIAVILKIKPAATRKRYERIRSKLKKLYLEERSYDDRSFG